MLVDFTVWDSNLVEKIEHFKNNCQKVTKVIFNGLLEFEYQCLAGSTEKMLDFIKFLEDKNIELHILTSAHSEQKLLPEFKHVHVHNWPTFWLTLTFTRLIYNSNYEFNKNIGLDFFDFTVGNNNEIIVPYITMNKLPKVHRAIMMDMLAKNNILLKDCVIWREWSKNYQFQYWKEEILLMDQLEKFECQEIFPKVYPHAFMQLVTESNEFIWILSEKTAMPLFFNKPFLVAGSVNFHKHLAGLGFKLYDELFDYSFDSEIDTCKRYDMLAKTIAPYVNKTSAQLRKIYKSVFEKCVYNKRLAMKLATDSSLRPTKIWEELIEHQIKNNIPDYPDYINKFILSNENDYRF